ncbi:MAG: selenocysteine-specific translation elongation factor [Bacteroidota bacterium]|nr:selenocysteine-specific translation elongation factor [Bacteroidota bacterium]
MKNIIIGTAGHIDHGKTALIKAMTNIDCDTHKLEKDRGITINLGFAHLNLKNGLSVGIVDMPGHKDFIDVMVSGASGIDLVLMIVAADSGIMPQTIEHLNIINILGVKNGIIVITKIDLVDEELLELVELEIQEQFEGSVLENAEIVKVSSITAQGIDQLVDAIAIKSNDVERKSVGGSFRMYPDRIFNVKGIGLVLTGSVLNGTINAGDKVYLLPSGDKAYKVRGLQRHAKNVEQVVSGDRAALNISGLKQEDFLRGMILSDKYIDPIVLIDANIELFTGVNKIKRWSGAIFHSGTYKSPAKIHLLNCNELEQGNTAIAQIHLEKPAILLNKDRFVLRSGSGEKTIGGGIVFDNAPLHHRKRTKKLLDNLKILSESIHAGDMFSSLINYELKKENKIFTLSELAERMGKPEEEIKEFIKGSVVGFEIYNVEEKLLFISSFYEQLLIDEILKFLDDYHKQNFMKMTGISSKEFLSKLKLDKITGVKYLVKLLHKLNKNKKIRIEKNTWILFDYSVKLDKKTEEDINWLEKTIKDFDVQKPIYSEIEEMAFGRKIKKGKLMMMLRYLGEKKKIVFHENDFIHSDMVNKVRPLMLKALTKKGLSEGDFRNLFGGTKKIIHPLMAIYIKEGIITREINIINITAKGQEMAK